MKASANLLRPGDPHPFGIENERGASEILFVSDHAGRSVPKQLGTLGLDDAELSRHIGYDIGIYAVTTRLARDLDAVYVFQPYSRLVIDCNRRPGIGQSIMTESDGTHVPGNAALSPGDVRAREAEILDPYHSQIGRVVRDRAVAARPTVLFAMHSCTPILRDAAAPRPWEISVIANQDWRIGDVLIDILKAETDLCVGINQPYTVNSELDNTIPLHAEAAGLPYVEIEIRQDLIADPAGQRKWAALLAGIFPRAVRLSGAGVA